MGILTDLGPLQNFEETKKQQKQLKVMGIKQFFHLLKLYSKWKKPTGKGHIKWGEQIEGHFLKLNEKNQLELCKQDISQEYKKLAFPMMFQFGSWMFQMIPKQPYNTKCDFYEIIHSIRDKYKALSTKTKIALTIPVIPFLGVINSDEKINNQMTKSQYLDDSHISNHPRFNAMTKHIVLRRGQIVSINVPIYQDKNTSKDEISKTEPHPNFIHMDSIAFGLGSSCLQCTFSTKDLDHARYVYDQLNVFSPIMLAITAGTPFYKGKIADWDARWKIISASADDRTQQQRDSTHANYIPTSRYNEACYYLSNNQKNKPEYNDFYTGVKEEDINRIKQLAAEEQVDIDEKMIGHVANIFKRDFVIVHRNFKEMSTEEFILFEMLNGTNWNSVRLKIPIDSEIGWRVQFRTMEVQLTADENSAYSLLIHLITRILHMSNELNFYIPITKLRENFNRAHIRDAVRTQKFFFRTNIYDEGLPIIQELTVQEILFGKNDFRGIFYEIEKRVEQCAKQCSNVHDVISSIRQFLFDTASGARLTLAQWMRRYVDEHPLYTHNSILPKKVMDDMLIRLHKISTGEVYDENFKKVFPDLQLEENEEESFNVINAQKVKVCVSNS